MSLFTDLKCKRDYGAVTGMMLYNDSTARVRVKRIYDHVRQRLSLELPVDASWWRFDRLRNPDVAATATELFLRADFIMVVSNEETPLPLEFHWWLSLCPPHPKTHGRTLLAYIEFRRSVTDHPSNAELYLHGTAQRMGFDYLPYHLYGDFRSELATEPRSYNVNGGGARNTRTTPVTTY